MTLRERLTQLIEYWDWANQRALRSLADLALSDDEARRRLAHVVEAELIWLLRIQGEAPEPEGQEFWPELSFAELGQRIGGNLAAWRSELGDREDDELEAVVDYRNSRGEQYSSSIPDIMLHLTAHGEHHRGQIAAAVRAAGGEPALTDFIAFTRQS